MNRLESIPFTDEQLQAVKEANDIEIMIALPAWKWFEDRMTELVNQSRIDVLNVDTSKETETVDAVRKWQLNDENISTIRSEISSRLEARESLINSPSDQMAEFVKEHLSNG